MTEEKNENPINEVKKSQNSISVDEMAVFCKKKGFVFNNSEIYGGFSGFFDYGPLGSELKKNLKDSWWQYHVRNREDVVGIDGSIITHPKVWIASGHVANFEDLMLQCSKCGKKLRADIYIEDQLNIAADGFKPKQINELVKKNNLKCPKCKSDFKEVEEFNLMFKTNVGPKQSSESVAYLRPETAQLIFVDFKNIVDTTRLKLPFGVAQIGKAFRNEISPRNFLFRCREFEQMEIEYFIRPDDVNNCPYIDDVMDYELRIYSSDMQNQNELISGKLMTIKEALDKNIIKTKWHAYWLANEHKWFVSMGANPNNFRVRQHLQTEKSHYALDTWDLEYKFPFGWKELQGMANRTDFDLKQHMKFSGKDLSLFDEKTKEKILPYVVCEPSQGVDRAFLVFMYDAYVDDKERGNIVLKLSPKLAPIQIGIFPLAKKLESDARKVYDLLKDKYTCTFDKSGSIGRRYARSDEIGIPWCITFDFDSLEDKSVTIRDRDTTKQLRVPIDGLDLVFYQLLNGKNFNDFKI